MTKQEKIYMYAIYHKGLKYYGHDNYYESSFGHKLTPLSLFADLAQVELYFKDIQKEYSKDIADKVVIQMFELVLRE